jgi:prepilin-type N-terminal cleavage/methylation domain-containing protein
MHNHKKSPARSLRAPGFTLIELMITMVIAVVLIGIGVPSFKDALLKYRSDNAVRNLYDDLLIAREESNNGRSAVTICASDDGASCNTVDWAKGHIVFRDQIGKGTKGRVDAGEPVVMRGALVQGPVVITAKQIADNNAFTRGYLQFNESKLDTASGIEFTVCYGTAPERLIRVGRNGNINTSKGVACK